MSRLRKLTDAEKIKVLLGLFAVNQVGWLLITKSGIKGFNRALEEQHKASSERYLKLHKFTGTVLDIAARDCPQILFDDKIEQFLVDERFERLIKDI